MPSVVAGLGDPAEFQLRGRRSGGGRLAAARVKEEAAAKEMTQLDRLTKASSEPLGFQVLIFIVSLPLLYST